MYTDQTGEAVLTAFAAMPPRQRRKAARRLIYKKSTRPEDLTEQLIVLDALETDSALTSFDHFYALIAGSHKVIEQVDVAVAKARSERMWSIWPKVREMPVGYGLRKDRTHLVFSYLNVAMNLDLLAGSVRAKDWAEAAIAEVDGLNPRQMTPYLFNSNSNTIKVLGIAVLSCRGELERMYDLSLRLVSYGIEVNNPIFWWVFSRFQSPKKFKDVKIRAAFESHRNTMRRVFAMEQACQAATAEAKQSALELVADRCIAQVNPAQKTALMEVVKKELLS